VTRLPPEIISHIARCLLHENHIVDARLIIPLTHVCQYWRESIVSAPENWALISSRRKGLAALSLERSKAAPLEVWLGSDEVPWFPGLLVPYFQTTKTLHVNTDSSIDELAKQLPNFPQSMPNLRSLSLTRRWYVNWDRSIDPFGPFSPTLKCLTLFGAPLYQSFLRLRTLTKLVLTDDRFDLRPDVLFDFLEGNRSLEIVELSITPKEPSLWSMQHRTAVRNRLQRLLIHCHDPMSARLMVSSIPLQRGAHLEIATHNHDSWLGEVLHQISTTHLLNLSSPTFMQCQSYPRLIHLLGPNGTFSLNSFPGSVDTFREFPLLPLATVRELHLRHRRFGDSQPLNPLVFFPALETLAVDCGVNLLCLLFSKPYSSPSLKTLIFLDCNLTEGFLEELARFASNRRNTASTPLHRVVIIDSKGKYPSIASIDALEKHVPVVDVRMGKEFPKNLT